MEKYLRARCLRDKNRWTEFEPPSHRSSAAFDLQLRLLPVRFSGLVVENLSVAEAIQTLGSLGRELTIDVGAVESRVPASDPMRPLGFQLECCMCCLSPSRFDCRPSVLRR
jgi:hypothetical protein